MVTKKIERETFPPAICGCLAKNRAVPTNKEKENQFTMTTYIHNSSQFYLIHLLTAMPRRQAQERGKKKNGSKCLIPSLENFGDEHLACSKENRKIWIEYEIGMFNITEDDSKIIESNWNIVKGPHNTAGTGIWRYRARIKKSRYNICTTISLKFLNQTSYRLTWYGRAKIIN